MENKPLGIYTFQLVCYSTKKNVVPVNRKPLRGGTLSAGKTGSGPRQNSEAFIALCPYAFRVIDPVLAAWATAGGNLP